MSLVEAPITKSNLTLALAFGAVVVGAFAIINDGDDAAEAAVKEASKAVTAEFRAADATITSNMVTADARVRATAAARRVDVDRRLETYNTTVAQNGIRIQAGSEAMGKNNRQDDLDRARIRTLEGNAREVTTRQDNVIKELGMLGTSIDDLTDAINSLRYRPPSPLGANR